MTRTFLDAGVLIRGARANGNDAEAVLALLDDREREFVSTSLLKLEVLPKSLHHKKGPEANFYKGFFDEIRIWVTIDEALIQRAFVRAARLGLSAMDGLHLEAAITAGAAEFITTEKPTKPFFAERSLKVTSIS